MVPLKSLKNLMCTIIIGSLIFCTFYWYILPSAKRRTGSILMEGNQGYWRWECNENENICQRRIWKLGEPGQNLRTCEMTCGPTPLWPIPNGEIILSNQTVTFNLKSIKIWPQKPRNVNIKYKLEAICQFFLMDIAKLQTINPIESHTGVESVRISISVASNDTEISLQINTDESYKLIVQRNGNIISVKVTSGTFFGARHALETLRQLIWFDDLHGQMRIIEKVKIVDAPLFTYRGLMLDTSNHFIPTDAIKRTINGMSVVKMNVFHWHLTDSFSFPFYSKNNKHAIYGAYSSKEIYTEEDIKSISDYALLRGIRIVMEIDNPGHIRRGWTWGPRKGYGDLVTCPNKNNYNRVTCIGPYACNLINPSNNRTYELLEDILKECNNIVGKSDLVHLGGSEIDLSCWENSSDVRKMKSYQKKGLLGVLKYHQTRMYNIIKSMNKGKPLNIILSSNSFKQFNDPTKTINSKIYVAQVNSFSDDQEEKVLIGKGYRVIVSHQDKLFLNHLPHWTMIYNHRPWEQVSWSEKQQILGGEASLWTEFVDELTLDLRLWPGTAAAAELFWSEPLTVNLAEASLRLQMFRERLIERGIKAAVINPKWCVHNPGYCL